MKSLLAFLIFLGFAQGYAANVTNADFEKAQKIAQKIEDDQKKVSETEKHQRQILSSLYQINQRIKKISKEKSDLESEKRTLEVSIVETTEKITELKEALHVKGRNLINNVRWIHQSRGFSWLNLFTESTGPAEADLHLHIFTRLTEKEKQNIKEYIGEKKLLQKTQFKLQARLDRLNRITESLQTKEKDFLNEQAERKLALSSIEAKKSKLLEKLKNYRNTASVQKLEDTGLLDGIIRSSFLESRGMIQVPVKGELKQRFGIEKSKQASYYKNNKGIFIQTDSAHDVRAVFEGKVAFVGNIGGFGRTAILDHGDHYYTVYSSLESVSVQEGQVINTNHPLGKAGPSDFFASNGIYFEIRHFSEPQDPLEWFRKGLL